MARRCTETLWHMKGWHRQERIPTVMIYSMLIMCIVTFMEHTQKQGAHRQTLTSLHLAPALLDTYTLGLLARFLPTEPAGETDTDTG